MKDNSAQGLESESEMSQNDYEKLSFMQKVQQLNNIAQTNLVKQVLVLCPSALADMYEDSLYIQVDQISLATFQNLENWVDEQLASQSETNESVSKNVVDAYVISIN